MASGEGIIFYNASGHFLNTYLQNKSRTLNIEDTTGITGNNVPRIDLMHYCPYNALGILITILFTGS